MSANRKISELKGFCIMPKPKSDFKELDCQLTFSQTEEKAWEKFCNPALNRKAYEDSGYKAVPVVIKMYESQ